MLDSQRERDRIAQCFFILNVDNKNDKASTRDRVRETKKARLIIYKQNTILKTQLKKQFKFQLLFYSCYHKV